MVYNLIRSGEMTLEQAKKLQKVLLSNLNKISKGKFKSEKQQSA